MLESLNLIKETETKISDIIEKTINLRKEIINNTNNFQEFKILKSEIIHQLITNEEAFRTLNAIIKTLTMENAIQQEKLAISKKDIENFEEKLKTKFFEQEYFLSLSSAQALQKNYPYNNESFVNDLLNKVSCLENIIKEYQTNYGILNFPTSDFSYKSRNHSHQNNPSKYHDYISRENNNNNIEASDLINFNKTSEKIFLNNHNQNPNFNVNNISNTSTSFYKTKLNLNYDYGNELRLPPNDMDIMNNKHTHSFSYSPSYNLGYKTNSFLGKIVNNEEKSSYEITISKPLLINKEFDKSKAELKTENNIKKTINDEDVIVTKNTNNKKKKENTTYYSNNKEEKTLASEKPESIPEKAKANLISEILLKIFSTDSAYWTLTRKYGNNFQEKLTDKNIDLKFLLDIEKEVNILFNKEKKETINDSENIDYKKLRKKIESKSHSTSNFFDTNGPYIRKKIIEKIAKVSN